MRVLAGVGVLLIFSPACNEHTIKGGSVWLPDDQCWDLRWLEEPIPFVSDMWELHAVDELGQCWFFVGTPDPPSYWGPPPISVDEACAEAYTAYHLFCARPAEMPW